MDEQVRKKPKRDPKYTKKNPILKKISNYYGDEMYQLCVKEFKEFILKHGDLLLEVLETHFPHSRLFTPNKKVDEEEYIEFVEFIKSFLPQDELEQVESDKTPEELLDEAGYILYECHTEEDIQSFRKYYDTLGKEYTTYRNGIPQYVGDELCTFNGGRLKENRVFFAVRKDVDQIKRKENPSRDDEYGTSVLSIQFSHQEPCVLSIKNRYNHNCGNEDPDMTLGNNLDRIIPGLTSAFTKKLGKSFSTCGADYIPVYSYKASDGKFYIWNCRFGDTRFCADNIIITKNGIIKYPNNSVLLGDNFIFDFQNKEVKLAEGSPNDSFVETIPKIETMEKSKPDEKGNVIVTINKDIKIVLNKYGRIIEYINPFVEKIGDNFLSLSLNIKKVELPNVKEVGDNFLKSKRDIEVLKMDNLEKAGNSFLEETIIFDIDLPKLKEVGNDFLKNVHNVQDINFPELEIVGNNFMNYSSLDQIILPKLRIVGDNFMSHNYSNVLDCLDLPNLEEVGENFLSNNRFISQLNLPKLKNAGRGFLCHNEQIEHLDLPSLIELPEDSLRRNEMMETLDLPQVVSVGDKALYMTGTLKYLNMPNVKNVPETFLAPWSKIDYANVPEGVKINGVNAGFNFPSSMTI